NGKPFAAGAITSWPACRFPRKSISPTSLLRLTAATQPKPSDSIPEPTMPALKNKPSSPATPSGGPQPGDKAPAFKLADDAGKTVTLADFKGKKVILYFYPKDNTPGCTTQACSFRDNLNRLGKSGAVVLGVSADSAESHRKFKEKQGLNFPLLSDPDHKALDAYGVWQEK